MRSIGRCVGKFGWQDISGGVMRELSEADMKVILLTVAWRNVRDEWRKEMHEKPQLLMMIMKLIVECEVESSCASLKSKVERRRMLKLRGGTVAIQIQWEGGMG